MAKLSNTSRANFFYFSSVRRELTWLLPHELTFKIIITIFKKRTSYASPLNNQIKYADINICTFSAFPGQLAFSVRFPFKLFSPEAC